MTPTTTRIHPMVMTKAGTGNKYPTSNRIIPRTIIVTTPNTGRLSAEQSNSYDLVNMPAQSRV